MGSQTLEILRQGFWASLTGGWFFDPHQEIFCNTFHMYLWLSLLITPFVLHLTAESFLLPMILYPCLIFILFVLIKTMNCKLHTLFDGEEMLEVAGEETEKVPPTEDIELNVFKKSDSGTSSPKTPQVDISLKEEIEDALRGSATADDNISTPSLPDNSDLPPIDLHSLGKLAEEALYARTGRKLSVMVNPMDDIFGNKRVLRDGEGIVIHNHTKVKKPSEGNEGLLKNKEAYPINRLLHQPDSTDSSWGSTTSSAYSSASEQIHLKFPEPPAASADLQVKSENLLSASTSQQPSNHQTDISNTDKTVSMPALETKDSAKCLQKNTLGVWFSLPEMENSSIENISLSNCNINKDKAESPRPESPTIRGTEEPSSSKQTTEEAETEVENSDEPCYLGNLEPTGKQRMKKTSEEESEEYKKHLAMSYEDTSSGAVHCFRDEFGNWYSYTFGEDGEENLQEIFSEDLPHQSDGGKIQARDILRTLEDSNSAEEGDGGEEGASSPQMSNDACLTPGIPELLPFWRVLAAAPDAAPKPDEPVVNKYYMLPVVGNYSIKVSFDRLALLAMLDRNKSFAHVSISVLLATAVAGLGYMLLSRDYFYDFWLFILCFVIAKCQFSLLKSVQPDSASPIHGHNSIIVFSRAVYFCIVAVLILALDEMLKYNVQTVTLYGVRFVSRESLEFTRDLLIGFLLAFPIIFLFGLLPQFSTFLMHTLEQLEIHLFGGSALTSIQASLFSFTRNLICIALLSAFCYLPLTMTPSGSPRGQHVLFSIYCGLLVATSYHLSRSTSSPEILLKIVRSWCCCKIETTSPPSDIDDPLPRKLINTMRTRLKHDVIVCLLVTFFVFAIHLSTVFHSLQPTLSYVLYTCAGLLGVTLHYVMPQLRKQLPWLFVSSPILKSYEQFLFECQEHSRIMWFERMHVWLVIFEKNILYTLICVNSVTRYADDICQKFHPLLASVVITTCAVKLLRSAFCNPVNHYVVLTASVLFFEYDYRGYSETFLIDYFFMAVFVEKTMELYLKFKFILTYTAPWQIAWGSAFHAFAQPFSLPHCGMMFVQSLVSTILSTPLNPFLGSAIFITSYMRPIKFWEKDYNTKRVDHTNTRLSSHIDSNPGADDNNLNSIFYEHLTRSLQESLCGDLQLGRWGKFASGDCFIIASYNLNALVHIIEIGNGYVTFQLRGLEFRGTYCQQREVEAITEDVEDDKGFCCFQLGHGKHVLSLNSAFAQRWLAWEVAQSKYIVEGYSVSDNTATTMFQLFDLRKIFITYYVVSVIFYCVRNKKLIAWLSDTAMMDQLKELRNADFVELDAIFRPVTDKDFDMTANGITRESFLQHYHGWIKCCNEKRGEEKVSDDSADDLFTLCFALSLLGRRLLSVASNNQWNQSLKSFLHCLHSLFKGDFRVTATKDEWIFCDTDLTLLRHVIAPAVRMALKLHQDHFTCIDEYEDDNVMYEMITSFDETFVISHEGNPEWRQAVLHNRPNLLALRYVMDDGTDDYKIIMLVKRCLNFRVIKVNKECVRGLWAGQLQELIFLRNRNPERGSIQNAKQALRNMINSSCDQPIGYPIYVSPLTTSYAETNPFYCSISPGNLNGQTIKNFFRRAYRRVVRRFTGHCAGSVNREVEIEMSFHEQKTSASIPNKNAPAQPTWGSTSYAIVPTSSNSSSVSNEANHPPCLPDGGRVVVKNINRITEALVSISQHDLHWPKTQWLAELKRGWEGWYPHRNMTGDILYHWDPRADNAERRISGTKRVYLLRVEDTYLVPVTEDSVVFVEEPSLLVKPSMRA